MPEKQSPTKTAGTIIGIVAGALAVAGTLFGLSFDGRIESNTNDIKATRSELTQHKDNSSIHRTAEEARVYQQAESDRWDQLFRELDQINKRIDGLESRAR